MRADMPDYYVFVVSIIFATLATYLAMWIHLYLLGRNKNDTKRTTDHNNW